MFLPVVFLLLFMVLFLLLFLLPASCFTRMLSHSFLGCTLAVSRDAHLHGVIGVSQFQGMHGVMIDSVKAVMASHSFKECMVS